MKKILALITTVFATNIPLGVKKISTVSSTVSAEDKRYQEVKKSSTDTVDLTMNQEPNQKIAKKVVNLPKLLELLRNNIHSYDYLKNSSISLTNGNNETLKWNNSSSFLNNLSFILNYSKSITKVELEVSKQYPERSYVYAYYKGISDYETIDIIGRINWTWNDNISSFWTSDIKCTFELVFE